MRRRAPRPRSVGPDLEAFLIEPDVEISAIPIREGSGWGTLLLGFGRSKARRYDQEARSKVTFDDVAGIDEAENELVEIVDFLRSPDKYTRLGGSSPKGVLLIGAPGTGRLFGPRGRDRASWPRRRQVCQAPI